ncbi:GABA A/glycine receptor subunit [Dirofilaria immitis]|nr:GABA A/glycine receptor subunit [Dirofilaria immitis]
MIRERTLPHNTSLIHNITRVLNTILLNQNRHLRPINEDPNAPLQVEIDISEFSLDCYFRQKWLDRRLAFDTFANREDLPISSKMLKDIWTPDTYIRNGRHSYLHTITVPNILFRVRYDGQIHVSQRLTIRSRCKMFFKKFPMDYQACPIEIGSLGYFSKDIVYVWKDVELDSKMSNMLAQYQLLHVTKTSYNWTDPRDKKLNVSVLKVYFKLQRQQGFYILQIYTPCTLIVVVSWVSFWINKESSPARVSLGIMTVLSVSTLGFGYRSDLPKVSHSTALDIYIISCFGFVFAAMIEYAIINYVHRIHNWKSDDFFQNFEKFGFNGCNFPQEVHNNLEKLETIDKISKMRLLPTSLMLPRQNANSHNTMILNSKPQPLYSKQERSVFHRTAAKAREKMKIKNATNVVSQIDSASKIVFPSLYILFNVIYWLAYLYWIPDEINSLI